MGNPKYVGDPEGKRLHNANALRLAEAEKVGQLLRALIVRCGLNPGDCDKLLAELKKEEQSSLLRGRGALQPSKRFKWHGGSPLIERRDTDLLYIDESGTSNIEPPSSPPFFTLGAVSMSPAAAQFYREAADEIKRTFFGRTDLTFHEPVMRRHDGPYNFVGDKVKQKAFDEALERLIFDTPFVAFGVAVRKAPFDEQFVQTKIDPYLPTESYAVAITMLMERYVDYLAVGRPVGLSRIMGRVTFESQGPKEDAQHQLDYAHLMLDGSQWVPAKAFQGFLEAGCHFRPKSGSDPTELADFLSRDLFEWVRSGCIDSPRFWHLFCRKVYCRGDGQCGQFGFKVFPDSDIRELVEAHRQQCGAIVK